MIKTLTISFSAVFYAVWLSICMAAPSYFLGAIPNPVEYEDDAPDMQGLTYGDEVFARRACNSSIEGLISRWWSEPYSEKALLCVADTSAWHGYAWVELHGVEP